jgi:hemerythrin-like domain-containing protein
MAPENKKNQIPPTEDLMREHGVLLRILLIYKAIIEQSGKGLCYPPLLCPVIADTAAIARDFIEEYHQRLEENYVFPVFLRHGQYVDLVHILLEQHNAARQLTRLILHYTRQCGGQELQSIFYLMGQYIRMYEPHSAREDTVIFPAFRSLVSDDEFRQLGELFEDIEEQKFGENGFQRVVNHIARIEQSLGIYDLSQFTPKLY